MRQVFAAMALSRTRGDPRNPRRHVRSNVVGYLALFVALSGVTYAAGSVPKNSVSSSSIKKGAVKSIDVRDGTLTGTDVRDETLTGTDVSDGTLTGADINEGTLSEVPNAGLLDGLNASAFVADTDGAGGDLSGSFSSLNIRAGAVGASELGATAVTPQNLAPNGTAGVQGTVPIVFLFAVDDGVDAMQVVPRSLAVADVWTIGKSADVGTVRIEGPGGTPITDQIDPDANAIVRASNIDAGEWHLFAGDPLVVNASNNQVDALVMVLAIPNVAP